jgi:transcriptional regulator with XRE-family HTH domain
VLCVWGSNMEVGVKLREWRGARSQAAVAKLLRVGQSTLSRLECGECTPKLALALRIEKATSGAIPAASWVQR